MLDCCPGMTERDFKRSVHMRHKSFPSALGRSNEVGETNFADLREIVRELAQAQVRTEARVEELAQAQLLTEARLETLTA